MWSKLHQYASGFTSGVLNACDADGYPASVRTPVEWDMKRQVVRVRVPPMVELEGGPASLLFHDHDAKLWNQHVLLVKGKLAGIGDEWRFEPGQIVPMMGYSGVWGSIKQIICCRKAARDYLRKRNLERPVIPWERIRASKHQVQTGVVHR